MLTKEEAKTAGCMAAKAKMIRAPCMDIAMCGCYTKDKTPIDADVFVEWYEGYDTERYGTMTKTFRIAKVKYTYTIQGKTAKVTREDGAWAKFHDDENYIDNWKDALMEMVADDNLHFSTE